MHSRQDERRKVEGLGFVRCHIPLASQSVWTEILQIFVHQKIQEETTVTESAKIYHSQYDEHSQHALRSGVCHRRRHFPLSKESVQDFSRVGGLERDKTFEGRVGQKSPSNTRHKSNAKNTF